MADVFYLVEMFGTAPKQILTESLFFLNINIKFRFMALIFSEF